MSSFITMPKKGSVKECSNYSTIALISHTSKVMLKILQARLQQYMNCELPEVQTAFRKGRGPRYQTANIPWIIEKSKKIPEKYTSASLTIRKLLTVWIMAKWKILKQVGTPGHLTCLLRKLYAGQEATIRTRHRTKLGKEYIKAVYCHCVYLTYMQSTSCEMLCWIKGKLEQGCQEKYQ